jgi:hypothetical protein
MKLPDLGGVLKLAVGFFKVISVYYILQDFEFDLKYLGYLTVRRWGTPSAL